MYRCTQLQFAVIPSSWPLGLGVSGGRSPPGKIFFACSRVYEKELVPMGPFRSGSTKKSPGQNPLFKMRDERPRRKIEALGGAR